MTQPSPVALAVGIVVAALGLLLAGVIGPLVGYPLCMTCLRAVSLALLVGVALDAISRFEMSEASYKGRFVRNVVLYGLAAVVVATARDCSRTVANHSLQAALVYGVVVLHALSRLLSTAPTAR